MKRISTLIIGFFVTIMAFAGSPFQSKLTISSANGNNIKVVVDNDQFDRFDNSYNSFENSVNGITITDLSNGYHTIKVYEARSERRRGGWGFGRRDRNRFEDYRLVYSNSICIRPFVHTNIVIDRFGEAEVSEILIKHRRHNDRDFDEDDRYGDRDWDRNRDFDRNRDRDWDRNRDFGRGREFEGRIDAAMNVNQYNAVRQTIQRESFDKGKLSIATQILSDYYITSAQAKELTMLFSFDDAKLAFAKFAYRRTVDKGSFFMIYDVFSFSSSKQELADYIRSYR
jgi:Domain of unknown function (DUF4476)